MVSFALAVGGRDEVEDAGSAPFFKTGVDLALFSEDEAERTGLVGVAPVFAVLTGDCEGLEDVAVGALEPPVPGRAVFGNGSCLPVVEVGGVRALGGSSIELAVAGSAAGSSTGVTFAAGGSPPFSSPRSTVATASGSATVVVAVAAGSDGETMGWGTPTSLAVPFTLSLSFGEGGGKLSFFLTQLGVELELSLGFLAGVSTLLGITTLGGVDVAEALDEGFFSKRPMRLATSPRARSSGRPILEERIERQR